MANVTCGRCGLEMTEAEYTHHDTVKCAFVVHNARIGKVLKRACDCPGQPCMKHAIRVDRETVKNLEGDASAPINIECSATKTL